MTKAPQSLDKLHDTHWTRRDPDSHYRHFTVTSVDKKAGVATLSPVLDGPDTALNWRDLRNRDEWTPGWQR